MTDKIVKGHFRIDVRTIQGVVINFHVTEYVVEAGDFISFFDAKKNCHKKFHASNCEIYPEEVSQ